MRGKHYSAIGWALSAALFTLVISLAAGCGKFPFDNSPPPYLYDEEPELGKDPAMARFDATAPGMRWRRCADTGLGPAQMRIEFQAKAKGVVMLAMPTTTNCTGEPPSQMYRAHFTYSVPSPQRIRMTWNKVVTLEPLTDLEVELLRGLQRGNTDRWRRGAEIPVTGDEYAAKLEPFFESLFQEQKTEPLDYQNLRFGGELFRRYN